MLVELSNALGGYLHNVFYTKFDFWLWLGLFAQTLFTARFVVQWWASERAGKSVIPFSFWVLSIGGGALLFLYALIRADLVYIIGQGSGLLIYLRNVSFVLKERAAEKARAEAEAAKQGGAS
ncbi:membrane protein [Labrys miyagiensis]|uniref:Membrane protein n=1 Tax=Labrys miyagiensis TaxID=346912 RepID=A0ABQ6CP31_9HYPH|nr:lipid-A-disaccharide synthase N-terminal domain-containing protein [Labrys miyagiensis]GLS21484.1 membrane protein [Labrys miyagiensis]